MTFATADLFDAHGDALRVPIAQWLCVGRRLRFGGPVATVKVFEDNSRVREAVSEPGAGRVLVVDGGGSLRRALVGDQLATKAMENGWAGAVVFGCIRDRAVIAEMDFGIRCLGTNPRKTVKRGEGQRDLAVEMAGVTVHPGDWCYVDEDGIVFSDGQLAQPGS